MALKLRGNIWYVYYRQDKKIVWRTLGTGDLKEAERHADAIMAQVHGIRRLRQIANAFPQPISLSQTSVMQTTTNGAPNAIQQHSVMRYSSSRFPLAKLYEIAERHRKLSPSHYGIWNLYLERCGLEFADEATPQNAQEYMDTYYKEKASKTYNNVRSALNMVFRSSLIEAGLSASPFSSILPRRLDDEDHFRAFTRDETRRILEALRDGHEYWKCLTMISLHTGLRLESCRKLSPSHIEDDAITIMPGKTARFNRAVRIPLMRELKEYIADISRLVTDAKAPFCSVFPVELRWSKKEWFFQGLLNSLGITDNEEGTASFASLRDTFATRCLEDGMDERVLRGMMGQRSKRMTDLYSHDKESAVRALKSVTVT